MSVNIKTASGLQKLSSNVTKNTIAGALGYTPANPDSVNADLRAHAGNTDIHVTLAEKDKFTDYKQLKNTPNITDDLSGDFSVVDSRGNAALQVDSTGTTNVAKLNVNGRDVETFMESTTATSNTHIIDNVRHITANERAHWNDKSKLEGNIQVEDTGDTFTIIDNTGNVALQVAEDGTTDVAKLTIKGADVEKTISDAAGAVAANLTNHSTATNGADGSIHIQPGERAKWNDTSKMEGNLQLQDEGKEFVISDNSGNVALQVTESGITQVAELEINGLNTSNEIARVESQAAANLSAHNTSKLPAGDSKHIQEGERAFWNDKQHLSGNIKIDDEGSEFVLTDKSGNVAFQVVSTGTTQIADLEINGVNTTNEIARVEGAASANLYAHTSRTDNPHHVTKAQVGLSNADNTSDADKPISTAQAVKNEALDKRIDDAEAALQTHKATTVSDGAIHIQENDRTRWDDKSWHSLTDRPNIVNNDESDEFKVIDSEGNVAILVDAQGTTNVANLEINGVNTANEITRVETSLSARITNVTGEINDSIDGVKKQVNTLIGKDSNKSVRKIANEELCAQLLTGKADADFKTLEQMATWLEDHPEDAADMNKRIEENSAAIVSHDESATTSDGPRHIQQGERTRWNDKSWHSLTDKPNIVNNDQSTEFQIVDSKGNVAVHVDSSGATNVAKLSIQGIDVNTTFDGINAEFTKIKDGTTVTKHAELADLATEAEKLKSSKNISLAGDATGSVAFDGSQDVTLTVTVTDNSHNHQIGITTEDDEVVNIEGTSQENAIKLKASHSESGVEVSDSTNVATYTKVTVNKYGHVTSGENPTTLSGYGITDAALQKDLEELSAEVNNIKTGEEAAVVKNAEHASYADVWTTKRKITLDGDASGSVEVDGSKDVTLTVTVLDNSHNHQISATADDDDVVILEGTSDINGVKYKASHAESAVTAGQYTRVTVDKYGHITSGDTPDASWSSIVGRPDIAPATDGNDTEILVKDSSDNVALQLDSTGVLNLAGATVNGIEVAVDYVDYTTDIAFDVTELVVS